MRRTLPLVFALAFIALALIVPIPQAEGAPSDLIVAGHVKDLAGVPMMSVKVSARSVSDDTLFTVFTGQDGNFSLIIPAGTYNISASIAGIASNVTYAEVPVSSNRTGLDFTVNVRTGVVSGRVSYSNVPLIGAQIIISNENATYVGSTTLPLGEYYIDGVVPGVFVGRAEMTGYWINVSQRPVYVEEDGETALDFVLEPQQAKISGKVTVGGAPEEGVEVSLVSGSSSVKKAVTDVNGNYSLSNIIAGDYQVVFSKQGLIEKTYPVSISPFEERELSVSMSVAPVQGGRGFIGDLDLTHSLMVVGLIVATLVALLALIIRAQAMKRPDLLAKEEEGEEGEEDKGSRGK